MTLRRAAVVGIVLAAGVAVVLVLVIPSRRLDAELRDPNPAVRAGAVRSLDAESDADRLLAALKDENADVRLLSTMQLGSRRRRTGPCAEKTVDGLIEALKDRHAGVRREAAESLGCLWPCSEAALTRALKDSDSRVRAGAAFALRRAPDGMAGREVTAAQAQPLQPLLRDLLSDDDPDVRANAAGALDRIH